MTTLVCQPCQNDELTVEAVGYCVDCAEYLCATCYKYHCKPQPCRHHVLLDKDNMPREPTTHVQADTCDKHKGKVLEYFCNNHDYIGCSVCMTLEHTTCEGKNYIPDIANSIPDSDEYKELQSSVNELSNFADEQIGVLNESLSNTETLHTSVVADILCFRRNLEEAIDVLENVVRDEVQILKDRITKNVNEKIEACSKVKSELERVNKEMDMSIKYHQFLKLFLAIKTAKHVISDLKVRLQAISSQEEFKFEFTPNLSILKLLNALETLGTVSAIRSDKITAKTVAKVNKDNDFTSRGSNSTPIVTSPASPTARTSERAINYPSGMPSTNNTKRTLSETSLENSSTGISETAKERDRIVEQSSETKEVSMPSNAHSTLEPRNGCVTREENELKIDNRKEDELLSESNEYSGKINTKGKTIIGKYMPSHSDDEEEDEANEEKKACGEIKSEPVGDGMGDNGETASTATEIKEPVKECVDSVDESEIDPRNSDGTVGESLQRNDEEKEETCTSNKEDLNVGTRVPLTSPKERIVVFLKDIAVTSTEDTSTPTICGMASINDDKIVVCDNENKSIKVVDFLTNIVTQTVKTDQSPWDVCLAGDERIAVTFPYSKQITLYKIGESVKKDYSFTVGGGCYGIAYANENLFVAFGDANVVKVMDLYGYVLRVLQNARGEKPIFNNPKHITAGPEGRLFYVANWGNDSITCLTALGHVAGIFTDRELKAPRGVAVDSFGLVYVCNYPRPSCIQVLTKGLNKVKKLLHKDKSIVNPLSLTYTAKGDWLFVGIKGENVKMYKLTV